MSDINFPNWDNIPKNEQEIIIEIIKKKGDITDTDILVDGPTSDENAKGFCEIACDAAQAVAIIACAGTPICIAAVIIAGKVCKEAC